MIVAVVEQWKQSRKKTMPYSMQGMISNDFKEAERDFNKVSVDNVVFSSVTLF